MPPIVATKKPLMPQTLYVFEDEWALGLSEVNLNSPIPGGGRHRYQIICVIRNDRPAEFREDMGSERAFPYPEFGIPGSVKGNGKTKLLHKVGELRELADWFRPRARRNSEVEPVDLMKQYKRVVEEERKMSLPSTFGYKGNLVRS